MRYLNWQECLGEKRFTQIIDVRSPGEYAENHIPGAVNLPVLDNYERAEVGRLYHQVSRFDARRLGAAMVARKHEFADPDLRQIAKDGSGAR